MSSSRQLLEEAGYTLIPPTRVHKKDRKLYLPKTDCKQYLKGRCRGLKELYCCKEKNCNFYKPKEEG